MWNQQVYIGNSSGLAEELKYRVYTQGMTKIEINQLEQTSRKKQFVRDYVKSSIVASKENK